MSKKYFISTLTLLFLAVGTLSSSSFTLSASDVFSVKFKLDHSAVPSLSKVKVKLSDAVFEADTKSLTAKSPLGRFYVYYAGGGGFELNFITLKIGFDFTAKKPVDPIEEGWTYNRRSATDRHGILKILLTAEHHLSRANLECKVHFDSSFGIYTDLRSLVDIHKNGIRLYAERTFKNDLKTDLRLEFGNIFGTRIRINTGEAPVYGQTSRKHSTNYEIWFKAGSITSKAVNVYKINADTGTEYYTDLSIKLESDVMDLKASTRLQRTSGSVYAFSVPSIALTLKLTQKTDIGNLSIQIKQDRSVKISLQSEISHVGAGKLRFTGDIDP